MTPLHSDTLRRIIGRALSAGGTRIGRTSFQWDVSGRCLSPVVLELWSRPEAGHMSGRHFRYSPGSQEPLRLFMTVPCRHCERCLRRRASLWTARAMAETRAAPRTWMASLTFTPEVHTRAYYRELARLSKRASDVSDSFRIRQMGLGGEVTKFFKRLRKNTGRPVRYMLVAEAHKSGLPHFHALIHERDYLLPVRHAELTAAWGALGHARFKLVENNGSAVRYVCKYVSKSLSARVRASLRYGQGPQNTISIHNELKIHVSRKGGELVTPGENLGFPPDNWSYEMTHKTKPIDNLADIMKEIRKCFAFGIGGLSD